MGLRLRRTMVRLPIVALGLGATRLLTLQTDLQGLFLPLSSSTALRCVPDSVSDPILLPGQSAYRFLIGTPALQVRNGSGELVAGGPAPRVVAAVFDLGGTPIALADSVTRSWGSATGIVRFDTPRGATGWGQTASIDSAEAMAIAMRLGPKHLMEAVAEAQKLERRSPKQALDSLVVGRARALAADLWLKICPNGRKA